MSKHIPDALKKAKVVSIFKKGDTLIIGNCRPISLLNCLYKIYAALIKRRVATVIYTYLHKTQYGFRAKRSTTQALYIARRIQDLSEQAGQNSIFVFLDWENTFDEIDQEHLLQSSERCNIPSEVT